MYHEIAYDLTEAHRNMERVLTLIQLQMDSLKDGSDPDGFLLLSNAIGYMRNYPGVIHHPVEELIFGKLIQHAPETRTVCARLHEQHQTFRQRESTLLRRIHSAQAGDMGACQQVKTAGKAYCTEHANHIRSEEVDLIPWAVRWLDEDDWTEIHARARASIDPALERNDLKQYDNLYDYLMSAGKSFNIH
jgi:hemerythrin-like domain-containing protein